MKKLLFINTVFRTFVKKDFEILCEYFKVKKFYYKPSKKFFMNCFSQIKLLFWLIKEISNAKYIFIWFADYHSFFPILISKICKKKSFLVIGGYEIIFIPYIKYGAFSNPLRTFMSKYSMKLANICLPVSHYVNRKVKKIAPDINTKVIYNGIEKSHFSRVHEKKNIILTVAICDNIQRIKLKGIDKFIRLGKYFPEYKFIAIGISQKMNKEFVDIPNNIQILDLIDHNKLKEYYRKAKIYCQFSLVESFGLAVGEAMLNECIPVVTKVGGLKELVDNVGFFVEDNSLEEFKTKIKQALNSKFMGEKARNRIIQNFSFQKRKERLINTIINSNHDKKH